MLDSPLDRDFRGLPEVQACAGVWQNAFHSYDVLGHTVAFVREMKELTGDPHLVTAGWLHDIGKPVVAQPKVKDGEVLQRMPGQPYHTFPNHEAVGAEMVRSMPPNLFSHHHLDQARVADLVACHYLPMRGIKRMRQQTTLEAYRDAFKDLRSILENAQVPMAEVLLMFLADRLAQGPGCTDRDELFAIRRALLHDGEGLRQVFESTTAGQT